MYHHYDEPVIRMYNSGRRMILQGIDISRSTILVKPGNGCHAMSHFPRFSDVLARADTYDFRLVAPVGYKDKPANLRVGFASQIAMIQRCRLNLLYFVLSSL